MISVALVDDHKLFRQGVEALLSLENDINVVLQASSGQDYLDNMAGLKTEPDVILMDLEMPEMDGITCTHALRKQESISKIIVVSMLCDPLKIADMIDAGANAYLLKNAEGNELTKAIRAVQEAEYYFNATFSPYLLRDLIKRRSSSRERIGLSEVEIVLLKQICTGRKAHEIADVLHKSKKTIDHQRAILREKTGCKSTASLVIYAIQNGYYDPQSHDFSL